MSSRGSIIMTIAQNMTDHLTLQEIEDLSTKLGIQIRHCEGEHSIMKCKLAIGAAEALLKDTDNMYGLRWS